MPPITDSISFRIGHGYDLHRLEPLNRDAAPKTPERGDRPEKYSECPKPFVLCGVKIDHHCGPVGHSDGDAGLHALTDAILGALGEPDIGELFPNTSPKWRAADSALFLREAVVRMARNHYEIANIDLTIILERPKLQPHKDAMRRTIAEILRISPTRVNVKGKTHEQLGALGEGRAVEVHAVVLLQHQTTQNKSR